ncbi:YHYH protein [Oceanobacter sp. 4_MG-2023]|uniref:YHYH protein n=1 Tax=Oceanobacter sp. 4_MG-2023 TaxID=3062623 RepID=UPI002734CBB2|nr:YHYH protein [Oceanobacter sp. 4_MG-2023]MDP2547839.1 YHYH protein [Oceanobacter sp. 4_MG-2023]
MKFINASRLSQYIALPFACTFLLVACDRSSIETENSDLNNEKTIMTQGLDISLFKDEAFIKDPEIVDCETNAGTKTTCYKLVSSGGPAGREPGDFCPRNITDGADVSGGWFSKDGAGDLVDLSGEFIANLASYYDDPNWKLYDPETGKVRYTATKEACFGAAKPDVEEQYKQNCIECELAYLDDDFSRTYLIPTQPIQAAKPERVRTVGIALDGAELAGPAPVDAILGSYTIAAFDDCGGHINAHQGYHYHSTTGCTDTPVSDDGYAPLIGYAPDGYAIYAMLDALGNEAESLDECRGTSDSVRGYHYRAASPSENMIIGCIRGEFVLPEGGPRDGQRPPPPHEKQH